MGHGVLTYALLAGLGAVDSGSLKQQAIEPKEGELVEQAVLRPSVPSRPRPAFAGGRLSYDQLHVDDDLPRRERRVGNLPG